MKLKVAKNYGLVWDKESTIEDVVKKDSKFYIYNKAKYYDFDSDHTGWENLNDFLFKIEQDWNSVEITLKNLQK